jgi:tetratricopeptide (TPR) repeat protein
MDCPQDVRCRPYEVKYTEPTHFGGLLPEISAFHLAIPRLAVLPDPKKMHTADKKAKMVYTQVFRGHFDCVLHCSTGELRVWVKGDCGDRKDWPDKYKGDLMEVTVMTNESPNWRGFLQQSIWNGDETQITQTVLCYDTGLHPRFKGAIEADDKRALADRILHHVVRQHGSKIPLTMLNLIRQHKVQLYTSNKRYQEAVDILAACTDCLVTKGFHQHDLVGTCLVEMGEAMEALGRFAEAAAIYEEAFTCYEEDDSRSHIYECAALAYKRAGRLDEAEANYVQAWKLLQWTSDTLRFHDDQASNLLTNILLMYESCHLQHGTGGLASPVEIVIPVLAPLLLLSGFTAPMGGLSRDIVFRRGKVFKKFLKKRYRTHAAAASALLEALRTPTLDAFRDRLLSCLESQHMMIANPSPPSGATRRSEINSARKCFEEGSAQSFTICSCSNPSCDESNVSKDDKGFMCCPCQNVRYCSKDCQISDWKEHRKYCAFQLAKKKKAAKAKQVDTDTLSSPDPT